MNVLFLPPFVAHSIPATKKPPNSRLQGLSVNTYTHPFHSWLGERKPGKRERDEMDDAPGSARYSFGLGPLVADQDAPRPKNEGRISFLYQALCRRLVVAVYNN